MYDCIVVGAGPAGATSAYHLAKKGYSVLILEKASLPRYKPCGGGVSPLIQSWFDFDLSPAISLKSYTVYCTWEQKDAIAVDLGNNPIWMVRRDVFDYFLVTQAVKQGATLKDTTEVRGVEFVSNGWIVKTENESFKGRYLIGADGAKGSMAKWLGFGKQKKSVVGALELEIPVQKVENKETYLEFGLVQHGYAWNFPKADGYSIGAGGFAKNRKAQSFHKIIENYTGLFNLNARDGCEHGHPLALWNGVQKLHTENAVLAGESACVVDPFTAEGIRPSIYSGLKASEAVANALAGEANALAKYSEIMAQEWGKEMLWAQRLASIFYRFPRLSYQLGVKHPSGGKTMMKIFAGEKTYSQVAQKGIKLLTNLSSG
ncbi:geranylgeranyl reductase family protein [Cyanobacterium aponinum AL20118]|uniref:Geranylgeranyl reductase family protein n=1 Tax=Cyanobacterium aponinum AL20115 TaxID=3090662 RepID=A0AAF1C5H1_9CHRO|nr:geranylgeranyl reductase family protein [Cyanobacterium aponinum]WPF88615.1 geranylgeranyl reductase family protein [Cyanobacterium aponinum AL20115]